MRKLVPHRHKGFYPISPRNGFSLLYILLASNDLVNDLIMIIAGSPESRPEPVPDN